MSTSILYHGWGVRDYAYERGEFVKGGLVFHLRQTKAHSCPVCPSRQVIGRGTVERRFKAMPIGQKPVTLVVPVQRVGCLVCYVVFCQDAPEPAMRPGKSISRTLLFDRVRTRRTGHFSETPGTAQTL